MGGDASILHADLDAFFASVEQRDDPRLRGRPVVVGGGVVLAASYEARAFGIRGAMGGREARRRCPHLLVVPPRFSAYVEASHAVFEVFRDTTPMVEGVSIDEAFLDVRGLRHLVGPPVEVARRLRLDVRSRTGLTITVGVARTKFLAKVASGVAKPDGLLLVPPDREREFLDPLPVGALWGVGAASSGALARLGFHTVADVAGLRESNLIAILGRGSGHRVHAVVHNRDPRPVVPGKRRRSVGSQSALGRTVTSTAEVDATLIAIVDRVTRRMRSADREGRTVTLRLRFGDFVKATRSRTLPRPTAQTGVVLGAARSLLDAAAPVVEQRGLTLLGVSVSNLDGGGAVQLELPVDPDDTFALDLSIDAVRDRFGSVALTRAVLLGRGHRSMDDAAESYLTRLATVRGAPEPGGQNDSA